LLLKGKLKEKEKKDRNAPGKCKAHYGFFRNFDFL